VLEEALTSGEPRAREAVLHTLGSITDERAAPLLVHILAHSPQRGAAESVYISVIEALGRCGAGRRGVEMLQELLYRGEWWAPLRTSRIRAAAARALHAAAADAVLEEASTTGSRGVRRAAALAMMLPRRSPPAGGTR
jgi:HEAT repeat protein